jgi:CheY-like chemotaxis protein
VQDDGIGIASDQLPGIFEMFAQVDTSLERSRDGLGIGLTLVKTLVEMHGGTVEARSDGLGLGSEFVVRLPLAAGAPEARPPAGAPAPPVSRRVLIVDDNEDGAASLAMLLRADGHAVSVAHDGAGATEAVAAFKPDVILLDIGLPGMNGYETCRAIRARPGGERIVIAALTGWGQDDDHRRSREAGFDAHLVKPVERDALAALLR